MAKMSQADYIKFLQGEQQYLDPVSMISTTVSDFGNMMDTLSEQKALQNAGREDLADYVVGNSWTDIFNNKDRLAQGIQTVDNNRVDVSEVNDINTLANIGASNNLQDNVNYTAPNGGQVWGDTLGDMGKFAGIGAGIGSFIPGVGTLIGAGVGALAGAASGIARGFIGDINNKKNARALNERINQANAQQINDLYDRAGIINQKQLRQNMMNYFAEGGLLNEFNTGGSHEENPLGGIPQGIASDGLPNLVEEGEVRSDFDDAKIFNNQDKNYTITEKDCEEYLLPKSVIGCNPAEAIKKLKKEYEDRVNDPVSIATMKEWDSRVFAFQEDKTAKLEEKRAKKAVKNMSDEEKAALMSSLEQPMAQQEGIDLSQPMYAKGGKIYIKPENRGKFTALKKRTGKSASWFKAHGTPAQKKMATFALNAKKWSHKHDSGDYLFLRDNNGNIPWYDFNAEVRDNPLFPYLMSEGNTQVSPVSNTALITSNNQSYLLPDNLRMPLNIGVSYRNPELEYRRQNRISELVKEHESDPTSAETMEGKPYYGEPVANQKQLGIAENYTPKTGTVNTDLLARRLGESLRYAPAIGAQLGAITAALQPKDYTLANRLEDLASEFRPISAPHIGGYRRYTPYDVNLGDAENIALTARALSANRGQNRATQGALNTAVLAKSQEASAKRNLAAQQANEANRLATDQYNLGIDQFNAQRDSAYDQLNQQILANRINMLGQAAQARDASRTAWASNINSTAENAFNQLGNVGRDNWNRNQRDFLLKALGREGLLELIKLGYFKS